MMSDSGGARTIFRGVQSILKQKYGKSIRNFLIKNLCCANAPPISHVPPPDLPVDLVEEILSRVPAKSLRRLRSTCKQWNTLFKVQRFTHMHFGKAPKQFLVLMLKDFRIFSMNVNLNSCVPSAEFTGVLELKDPCSINSEQVDIYEVFHCDGLLLCTTKDKRLMVWNPCLGRTRWIQLKEDGYKNFSMSALGYQKNKSCHNYKILRCWECHEPYRHVVGIEIYEFSTNSWRVDDVALHCSIESNIGISLHGNTYWLASNNKNENSLLCFDFGTEKFKSVCPMPFECRGWMALSVVKEEQLSVVHQNIITSKVEIWVTNKIDADADTEAALIWRKSFTVDSNIRSDPFPIPISFLIDEEMKRALCCNATYETKGSVVHVIGEQHGYYTQVPYPKSTKTLWWWPYIFNYVPSLVHIQ